MPGKIKLDPGPPTAIWDSDGIRLRSAHETNLKMVGLHVKPTSGNSYFTYVKVTNIGTDPIGPCQCHTTGPWQAVTLFVDTFVPPMPVWPVVGPGGQSKLTYLMGTDQFQLEDSSGRIAGPWFRRGKTATGAQTGLNSFWGWSPDGLFFAVATRDMQAGSGGTWWLEVYATRQYTRGDGIRTIPRGTTIYSTSGISTAINVIAGVNLGWNHASTCLELRPPPVLSQPLTQTNLLLICPYADAASNTAPVSSRTLDTAVQQLAGWDYRHSPCGGVFALVPKPNPALVSAFRELQLTDIRRTLMLIPQRVDNLPAGPALVNVSGATLTTVAPGRRGITLTNMTLPAIDNPECSAGSAADVEVRRVRVSTNPNQIDYVHLGHSSAALLTNESIWVEFPSLVWVNPAGAPGQLHYCLQANADASPDDPTPGWANASLTDRHFAQRNIVFA